MRIERRGLEDFEEGRQLLRQDLGGFFDHLQEGICPEARDNKQLVGAAYAPYDPNRAREFLRHTLLLLDPGEALSTAGLVVAPKHRRRGTGRALLLRREEEARQEGYRYMLCQSWLQSPDPSHHLLRNVGMQEAARIPGYWKKDYPIERYCSRCGDFCSCTALLFYKELHQ